MSKYKWWLLGAVVILGAVIILWATLSHAQCTAKYPRGTKVTITAVACPGNKFVKWTGACTGTQKTCVVTMTGDMAVTAEFTKLPAVHKNLRITKEQMKYCNADIEGFIK